MSSNQLDLSRFKTSSAGTTVDSNMNELEVNTEYTWIGWFFITFFGTTRIPKRVSFKCLKSGEIFEDITDQDLIEHYITYRRK